MTLARTQQQTGIDNFGVFEESMQEWTDTQHTAYSFVTSVKTYPDNHPDILVFTQRWPKGGMMTQTGSVNKVISSFPSVTLPGSSLKRGDENGQTGNANEGEGGSEGDLKLTLDDSLSLGFVHFAGFMAAGKNSQFGRWGASGGMYVMCSLLFSSFS